jgi:hypothetical protein
MLMHPNSSNNKVNVIWFIKQQNIIDVSQFVLQQNQANATQFTKQWIWSWFIKTNIKPKPFPFNLLNNKTINNNETTWMQITTEKKKTKMLHDLILKTYLIRIKTHWKETNRFLWSFIKWNINIIMKYLVFAKLTIEWNIIIWNEALGFCEVHIRKQKDLKNSKEK